jgi:hypothetical protein
LEDEIMICRIAPAPLASCGALLLSLALAACAREAPSAPGIRAGAELTQDTPPSGDVLTGPENCMAECAAIPLGPLGTLIGWIRELDSDDSLQREIATTDLINYFRGLLASYHWALRYCLIDRIAAFFNELNPSSPEVRHRLDSVLAALSGPIQRGVIFPSLPLSPSDANSGPFLGGVLLGPPLSRGQAACDLWSALRAECNVDAIECDADDAIPGGFRCMVHALACSTATMVGGCLAGQELIRFELPWGFLTICRGPVPPEGAPPAQLDAGIGN